MNTNERYKLFTLLNRECNELKPYYFKRKHIIEIHERNSSITYRVNNFIGEYVLVVDKCHRFDDTYYNCILCENDKNLTILSTFTIYEPTIILSDDDELF